MKTLKTTQTDVISQDSILVKFCDITSDKRLPSNVSTSLLEHTIRIFKPIQWIDLSLKPIIMICISVDIISVQFYSYK